MRRSISLKQILAAMVLLFPLVILSGGSSGVSARATITCDPWPTASATPEIVGSPAPASDPLPFPDNPGTVTIFAASSLTDAFSAIETDLEQVTPGLDLVFNFAGSQALATQLAEGAAADLFASANLAQMQSAIDAGVIAGTPTNFASNRLTIVVPADNPAGITTPADLANDGVQLVLAADTVPAGQYARESLCLMGADVSIYGDGFVDRVASNIVSNETNVRNVLAKVELGEADAGIVYVSDVTSNRTGNVQTIEIPEPVNRIATYPIAPVEGGNQESAAAFISYLLSPAGQATLAEYGFGAP